MILAIDTSVGSSVAIVDAERVLVERSVDDSRRHAELIGDLIRECLTVAGLSAHDVYSVAVGMGPGPFTGLRVGIAAANAFAFGRGIDVLRVASHDAIALEHLSANPGSLVITTDARRRERYWSSYAGLDEQGLPVREAGPSVERELTDNDGCARLDAERVSAGWLGVLALRIRQHNREFADAEPLYLRSPDVTVPGAQKRVTENRVTENRVPGDRKAHYRPPENRTTAKRETS